MRNDWLITFRSVTFAQKAHSVLLKAGINSAMQRTPRALSERGCGYCLLMRGQDVSDAVQMLQHWQITYGKIYEMKDGHPQEQRV